MRNFVRTNPFSTIPFFSVVLGTPFYFFKRNYFSLCLCFILMSLIWFEYYNYYHDIKDEMLKIYKGNNGRNVIHFLLSLIFLGTIIGVFSSNVRQKINEGYVYIVEGIFLWSSCVLTFALLIVAVIHDAPKEQWYNIFLTLNGILFFFFLPLTTCLTRIWCFIKLLTQSSFKDNSPSTIDDTDKHNHPSLFAQLIRSFVVFLSKFYSALIPLSTVSFLLFHLITESQKHGFQEAAFPFGISAVGTLILYAIIIFSINNKQVGYTNWYDRFGNLVKVTSIYRRVSKEEKAKNMEAYEYQSPFSFASNIIGTIIITYHINGTLDAFWPWVAIIIASFFIIMLGHLFGEMADTEYHAQEFGLGRLIYPFFKIFPTACLFSSIVAIIAVLDDIFF